MPRAPPVTIATFSGIAVAMSLSALGCFGGPSVGRRIPLLQQRARRALAEEWTCNRHQGYMRVRRCAGAPLYFSFTMVGIAAVGLLIGIAVGCVGIGGVLLVPILTLALGIDVKHAIAAALLSYLPSGVVAVTLYARRGSVPWREARLLCLAALPAAYLGARAASLAPAGLLEALIGLLLLGGGLYALRGAGRVAAAQSLLATPLLLGLGAGTGFISALTGAGGAF